MNNVIINRIELDDAGHLRIYPGMEKKGYEYIWRSASSVRWDAVDHSLFVLPIDGFTLFDEFLQIVSAVESEYDDRLLIDSGTHLYVDGELAKSLMQFYS